VGNEDGFAPYPCWNGIEAAEARTVTATSLNSNPDGDIWMPNEVDVSIRRPDRFWSTQNENKVLTLDQLLSVYYRSVGRGAQLLLNIPANRDGLLSSKDCASARTFGNEIKRRFSVPAAEISGSGDVILLDLKGRRRVVMQEEIGRGERVRAYRLEGQAQGAWRLLGDGSVIGHRRIQPVLPGSFEAIRLTVLTSEGRPYLGSLAAFNTGQEPPDWKPLLPFGRRTWWASGRTICFTLISHPRSRQPLDTDYISRR
jgi:alpha-L-fucosidase